MADVYVKYRDQLEPFLDDPSRMQPAAPLTIERDDLAALPSTIAGQVLASRPGANFQALFTNFNLLTNGFTWDPSGRGAYTVPKVLATLDGTRTSGECKILAAALLGLWVFPPPLGLGQSRSSPNASLYTFKNYDDDNGFISHHPPLGVRNLAPNIMHPHGTVADLSTRQPLYQWGDHKIVFYDGKLWDPSYKAVWAREEEMVAFEFTGLQHPRDANAHQVKVVTPSQAKGWLANQLMYLVYDLSVYVWKGPYRELG